MPTSVPLFFRFGFNILFLLPLLLQEPARLIKVTRVDKMILRSLVGLASLACMFYAIKYMPLANAVLLNNSATLFIPLIVWIMVRTKTSIKILLSIFIGFIGVILVLGPDKKIFDAVSMIGLASGIFGAIALVLTRDMAKSNRPAQIIFYYALTGSLISFAFAVFQMKLFSLQTWIFLCGVGIFGALYQIFVTHALKRAKVRYMSSLSFLSFIFAGFFDWLIWGKIPHTLALIGMVLVIVGGFLTIYFGSKEEKNI